MSEAKAGSGTPRFMRCLGCGEPLHSEQSQRLGAGPACRERLGADELARRRTRVLAGERAAVWLRPVTQH